MVVTAEMTVPTNIGVTVFCKGEIVRYWVTPTFEPESENLWASLTCDGTTWEKIDWQNDIESRLCRRDYHKDLHFHDTLYVSVHLRMVSLATSLPPTPPAARTPALSGSAACNPRSPPIIDRSSSGCKIANFLVQGATKACDVDALSANSHRTGELGEMIPLQVVLL
ncbi:hypothetical protein BDN67DRAFT_127028 [Paxillus ammoniavirescens]|nr:hypothetical protein BDN67DRAFT_127028 [Paxillus ammoniavirescens]